MSRRRLLLLLAFVILAISPKVVEPAYNGYLVAFVLLFVFAHLYGARMAVSRHVPFGVIFLCVTWLPVVLLQTYTHSNALRDVLRDLGVLMAFYVGYATLPRLFASSGDDWRLELMQGISNVGWFVVLITIAGAALAFLAGADAYFWRGQYVPMAHSWLPYIFAVNLGLARMDSRLRSRYLRRALFCVMGTLASLSRTDLVLIALIVIVQAWVHFRYIASDPRALRFALITFAIGSVTMPLLLQLSVVQERIEVGVDEDDPSLAWRFIENLAFLDQYLSADSFTQWFGFGLGGRLSLPLGVVDFNGNDTIPHLHNSYLTLALKFGIIGLIALLFFLFRLGRAWWNARVPYKGGVLLAAGWMLLFVLAKAVTLQGLSEWSHVLFFGLACALIFKSPDALLRKKSFGPRPVSGIAPVSGRTES